MKTNRVIENKGEIIISKKKTDENNLKVTKSPRSVVSRQSVNLTEWHTESTKIKEMTEEYAKAYASTQPGTATKIASMEKQIRKFVSSIKDPEILKDSIDTLKTLSNNANKPEEKTYKQTAQLVISILNAELKKPSINKRGSEIFGTSKDALAKELTEAKKQKNEGPKVAPSGGFKKG